MDQQLLPIPVLPEPYEEICRTIEAICANFPGKYWRDLEDAPLDARYPEHFVAELEQAGFLAAGIPEEHGGTGLPVDALARIIRTVHSTGCTADAVAEQMALTELLVRHAGENIKADILPRLADGRARLQSLAIWEQNSGRDASRIEVTARSVAEGFEISGSKRWVRFIDRSDLMLLVARTGEERRSLSLFLVDVTANRDKLKIDPIAAMNNYCGYEVTVDRMFLPAASVVGTAGKGLEYLVHLETIYGILAASASAGCSQLFPERG